MLALALARTGYTCSSSASAKLAASLAYVPFGHLGFSHSSTTPEDTFSSAASNTHSVPLSAKFPHSQPNCFLSLPCNSPHILHHQASSFRTFFTRSILSSPAESSPSISQSKPDDDSTNAPKPALKPPPPGSPAKREEVPPKPKGPPLSEDVSYTGAFAKPHRSLKRVSIANTAIAIASVPYIWLFAEMEHAAKLTMCVGLVGFGVMTTFMLHWLTHPYVHALKYNAKARTFHATRVNMMGSLRHTYFGADDIEPVNWDRPLATFKARDKLYYVDEGSFPDEHVLKLLVKSKSSVSQETKPPGQEAVEVDPKNEKPDVRKQ